MVQPGWEDDQAVDGCDGGPVCVHGPVGERGE